MVLFILVVVVVSYVNVCVGEWFVAVVRVWRRLMVRWNGTWFWVGFVLMVDANGFVWLVVLVRRF